MTAAQTLLKLQELDLAIDRNEASLRDLPELRELARKRSAYQKLKTECARQMGIRKDIESEVEDLLADRKKTEDDVTLAQEDAQRLKDYSQIQELEVELSDLAKKLDKIAHTLADKDSELAEARDREEKLGAYIAKYEQSLLEDARKTKETVTAIRSEIERDGRERARLASEIDQDLLAHYEESRTAHRGIGVEVLNGGTPSACRMALTEASLDDLSRSGEIASCPYCGRILVRETGELS